MTPPAAQAKLRSRSNRQGLQQRGQRHEPEQNKSPIKETIKGLARQAPKAPVDFLKKKLRRGVKPRRHNRGADQDDQQISANRYKRRRLGPPQTRSGGTRSRVGR